MKPFYVGLFFILLFGCEISVNNKIKDPFLLEIVRESGPLLDKSELSFFEISGNFNKIEIVINGLEKVKALEFFKTLRYVSSRIFAEKKYKFLETKYILEGGGGIQMNNEIIEGFEVIFNKNEFQEKSFIGDLEKVLNSDIKEALNELGDTYMSFEGYEYCYFEHGFSLCPINEVVRSIFYYSNNTKEGFNEFNGILPYKLKFGMDKTAIIKKFGSEFIRDTEFNMIIYKGLPDYNLAFTFSDDDKLVKIGLFS